MKMKFIRFTAIITFLVFYWITYPWYTISYEILTFNITENYLCGILLTLYALLEYKLSMQKKANEFYHFIFWFILLISLFPLYITIIQTFVLNQPVDFLINIQYLKIQINYSVGFLLREMHQYFCEIEVLTLDKSMIFPKLLSSICLNEVLCSVKTLKDLEPLKTFCINLCFYVEIYSPKIIKYHLQEDLPTFMSTIIETLIFGVVLKITCYSLPQIFVYDIPKLLLKTIFYRPFRQFLVYQLNRVLIIQMTSLEFLDFCNAFESWLLRQRTYTQLNILVDAIKHYFF